MKIVRFLFPAWTLMLLSSHVVKAQPAVTSNPPTSTPTTVSVPPPSSAPTSSDPPSSAETIAVSPSSVPTFSLSSPTSSVPPVSTLPSSAPTNPPIQPRVTTLTSHPARRSGGILTFPEGSIWCRGRPTIWVPGHQNTLIDTPHCFIRGKWVQKYWAQMDVTDDLNSVDDPTVIDRHGCGAIDANGDGRLDLYCLVGANRGMGVGFNEVYLSRKNGSLYKKRRHGLQRFRYARTRHTVVLNGLNGTQHVFISASYGRRDDGRYNKHAMFVKTGFNATGGPASKRYFSHVRGDWQRHTNASCAIAADINRDGRDDLILCNELTAGYIFVQTDDGGWRWLRHVQIPNLLNNWRNARVADFNGDGLVDLAVTHHNENDSFLRIFRGIAEEPYFDFTEQFGYYARVLPFAAPDLEAVDANGDGIMDLYIVQADERRVPNNYCGGVFRDEDWYTGGPSRIMPPANYTPPVDTAPDLLLISNPNTTFFQRFREVQMSHAEPGCGYFVKKNTDRSLVLAQGGFVRPGHQLLLEWD